MEELVAVWRYADDVEVLEGGWLFDHFYPMGVFARRGAVRALHGGVDHRGGRGLDTGATYLRFSVQWSRCLRPSS